MFTQNAYFFLLIVILSSLFRITNLDLIEFKTDEAINLLLAARPLFGHPFAPGGTVSSIGILNPPFFNYLLFPITYFTLDPKNISLFIALANSFAIGFLFLLIRRYYGFLPALIAGLFFAFSPWAILYSRKIWMQDLLVPFFVLYLLSIHKIVLEKKMFYWTILGAASLFLLQLHQASIVFVLIVSLSLLRKKFKVHLLYLFLGLCIGIIPLLPYLSYELKNGCPDCRAVILSGDRLEKNRSADVFLRPLQIVGQGDFRHVLGNDMLAFANEFPLLYQLRRIFYLEYLLVPFGIFIFIKKFKKLSFLAYATILLPFAYFILKIEPSMHYFLIVLPLLFLFLSLGLWQLLSFKNLPMKVASLFIIALLLGLSIWFNLAFYSLLRDKQGLQGDYGPVYAATEEEKRDSLVQYSSDKNYQEIFIASYIPKWIMYGDLPIPRMLYSFEKTKENLTNLEKQLKERPKDPLIQNELIAFYTRTTPTLATLSSLRKKVKENPEYKLIYQEAKEVFQRKMLKKIYEDQRLVFAYPQHWLATTTPHGVKVYTDNVSVTIFYEGTHQKTFSPKMSSEESTFANAVIEEILKSVEKIED